MEEVSSPTKHFEFSKHDCKVNKNYNKNYSFARSKKYFIESQSGLSINPKNLRWFQRQQINFWINIGGFTAAYVEEKSRRTSNQGKSRPTFSNMYHKNVVRSVCTYRMSLPSPTNHASIRFLPQILNNSYFLGLHGDQRKVQTGALADDCQDGELDADASGQAAFPHLKAGVGVASLDGATDSVVPNVHNAVPSDKYSIKEGDKLQKGIKGIPLDNHSREGDDNESYVQPNQ